MVEINNQLPEDNKNATWKKNQSFAKQASCHLKYMSLTCLTELIVKKHFSHKEKSTAWLDMSIAYEKTYWVAMPINHAI